MTSIDEVLEEVKNIRREIVPRVDENVARLDDIQPKVENHQLLLYGDPDDRKDTGMIGAFNAMESLFNALKSWGGKLAGTAITGILFWIAKNLFEMWVAFKQLGGP